MKKLSIFLLLAVLAFIADAVYFARFNKPAAEIKERVDKEYASFIKSADVSDTLDLANIGGEKWDYICKTNYYQLGESWAARYLRIEDLKDYRKADIWFDDAQDGLVFVNAEKKILVSLFLETMLESGDKASVCGDAQGKKITVNKSNNYIFLTYVENTQ